MQDQSGQRRGSTDSVVSYQNRAGASCAWLCLLLVPAPLLAAGLELPDHGARALGRGGAFTARADDLTAVALNPGALSRFAGAHLTYSHNIIWGHVAFTRAESQIPETIDYGDDPFATVENEEPFFPLGVMLAGGHDFGLEDWYFALSVYGPNAAGGIEYPVTGGQRYMLTSFEAATVFYGLSAAYGSETWGAGATVQYAHMPFLRYSLVVDGQPGGELNPYASSSDVQAIMDVSDDFSMSAIVGAWWRPSPIFEIGVAGRVVPVYFDAEGDIRLENVPGQTQFTDEQLVIQNGSAAVDVVLPPTARLGLRYRNLEGDTERFDLELDVVYEAWSMVEAFEIDLEGQIGLLADAPAQDVVIEKRWQDTLSVRLGGSYNVVPDAFGLSLGGFWEQGATPLNYSSLDFLSFDRLGVAAGLFGSIPIGESAELDLVASYSHVFQDDREVSESTLR